MEIKNLYKIAQNNGIWLDYFPLGEMKSLAVSTDKRCYIALDPKIAESSTHEKVCLAHELGHCMTGSFYNVYSPLDLREKHEKKADEWAVTRLVPYGELIKAARRGDNDVEFLAEYFGVTTDFMQKAIKFYDEKTNMN